MNPFYKEYNYTSRGHQPGGLSTEKAAVGEKKPINTIAALTLGTGKSGEASQIHTSPFIVGLPPKKPQHQHELELKNIQTYLFFADAKIIDEKSGGSQIVFRLRSNFNLVQNPTLEDFWQKFDNLLNQIKQPDITPEVLTDLLMYFAPEDILYKHLRLISAAEGSTSFEEFKVKFEQNVYHDEMRGNYAVFETVYRKLGYSMDFNETGVFLTVPDLRYLNYHLNALYKERPRLPHVKIGYCEDKMIAKSGDKKAAIAQEASDVLVSTKNEFLYNMTSGVVQVLLLMLEAEGRKGDLFSKGMTAYRNSIAYYYNIVKETELKITQSQTSNLFGVGVKYPSSEILNAHKLANLNLSAFLDMWLVGSNLKELMDMTPENMVDLLYGELEPSRLMHYSRYFAKHGEEFEYQKLSEAWGILSDFIHK